jgi:hypothetical protein
MAGTGLVGVGLSCTLCALRTAACAVVLGMLAYLAPLQMSATRTKHAACAVYAAAGAVVLVVLAYLIPLLVGLGVTTQTGDWKLGYFASVANQVGLWGWAGQGRAWNCGLQV